MIRADQPAAARNPISPFPFPLRGKPGRAGAPHAANTAAPPARGISKRAAEIPLARSPCRRPAGGCQKIVGELTENAVKLFLS